MKRVVAVVEVMFESRSDMKGNERQHELPTPVVNEVPVEAEIWQKRNAQTKQACRTHTERSPDMLGISQPACQWDQRHSGIEGEMAKLCAKTFES